MNKVASYIGNLGKSVGFMTIDAVKGYSETGSEFIAQNSELFKEIYSGIKNYRQTVKRTGHLIKQSTVYDSGEKLIRNVFDDIRTGNLYNKQRIDKYEMEALGMDDFGADLDIDMEAKEDSTAVEISAEDRRAARTNSVIEMASAEASSMIASTTAKTGQYIVSNMHASDQMRKVENTQLIHSLATGFGSVQQGIAKVLDFANGPLVTHMQNSAKYYETSVKLMQEQNAMFKEFLQMQREQYKVQLEQEKKNKLGYGDIVGANGTPDLKAYAKMVGGNAKNIMSEFGMDMLLGDGLGGKKGSMLNAMLANPIGALGTMAIKALIPQVLKNTAESFNESLQGLFGTIIGRFNRMAKGDGIGSYLGRLFGIRNTLKEDVSAGQFKKGPVPFDGITRNAIINVIPSHLRRIEAAITNKPERVFDSETGKWSTAKDINAKYEDKKKSFRDQAVGDTEKEMHDMIKKLGIMDRAEEQKLLKGMSDLLTNMYKTGGTFNFAKKGLDGSDYGIDDQELFDNLLAILNASSFKSGGKRGNKNLRQLDSKIINARTAQTKWAEDTSLDGASAYGLIASGDIDPRLLKEYEKKAKSTINHNPLNPFSMLDKNGNDAYYYMRSILAELRVHREILSGVPKGRGKRQKTSITIAGKSYSLDDLSDSDVDRLVKSSVEKSEAQKEFDRKTQLDDRHKEKTAKSNKERGWADLDELTSSVIASRIKDLKIQEEMQEMRDARSRDGSIIKGGRKAADNYEKRKKAAKDGKGSFMDQLIAAGSLGEKMKVIQEGISHIASKPAQILQGVIESADTHLYNFFFGETDEKDADGNPIRGFMGKMTKELHDTFSKFNDWLNNKLLKPMMEKLGLKTWEDVPRKAIDFLVGREGYYDEKKKAIKEKASKSLQPYREAIKSAFGTARKDVVTAFSTAKQDYQQLRGIDPNAVAEEVKANARGARYITKSGITAISEGEMIIPSELNPYNPYRLATNKAAEIANEESIRTRFSNRLANLIKRRVHKNAEGNDPITPADASTAIGSDKAGEKIVDPNSIIGTLEGGISTVAHRLFGKDGQSKEQFDGMMSGVIGQVKSAAPDAVGQGLLGGTLGLLIGGPGAIMLGAAAGAAKGIIGHSEGLQNLLFGQVGEDGEREGGMISKKLQQNFSKYFPDMKNYGIVGGLTLFPFLGPIGGILAGSALGFAKNNNTFQNYLFGEVNPETGKRDLESGLIGGANKEKLKKAFPAIGAGALAGLFLGPFGIIGNAAMGAGVGMLSTTDKFKDVVLGKEDENGERKGGVLGAIKTGVINPIKESLDGFKERVQEFIDEDILEPLKEFMEPFAQGAKNFFGNLLKTVGHGINKLFENSLGIPLDRLIKEKIIQPLTGFVGKTLKLLTAPLRTVVSAPFKFLGGIGNSMRKAQVKKGTADDMTAAQRLKFRSRHGIMRHVFNPRKDRYLDADMQMDAWFRGEDGADVTGEEFDARAEEMRGFAQRAADAAYADEDFFLGRKRALKKDTSESVAQWFEDNKRDTKKDRKRIRDRILKAINDGDIDKASSILMKGDFSRNESEQLQKMINEFSEKHALEDAKREKVIGDKGLLEQTKRDLAERFGITNIKDKDVARIAKNLNSELAARGLNKVKANVEGEGAEGDIANYLSNTSDKNPLIEIIAKAFEKGSERVNAALEKANVKKDQRAARNLAKIRGGNIGNEDFDFSDEFVDWAGTKRASKAVNILARTKDGQQDSEMADRLMRAAKSGDKKAMRLLDHMSKNTDRFNLTADDIGRISALTGRKRRNTKKVLKTKGFKDMTDFYLYKDLSKRDRKWVAKHGESLRGMYSDDAAALEGTTAYEISRGIESHALGGLVGKAWDATKDFGTKVNKKLSVLSAGEAGVDPKTKEGMDTLVKAKETQEENLEIAQENVEVDKEQTSVLKQISAQLKDVWKNQDLSLRTKITDTGKVIRIGMGKDGTPQAASDKSSVEAIKEEQEDRSIMRRLADGVSGFGEKIGSFLGFGKDEDDDKVSWFDKIKDAIVKGLGAVTIAAATGHAVSTWDDKIKPWIEEKMQGWLTNPESPAYKIAAKLDNFYQMFYNWVTGANGSKWSLPGIIQNYGTWMQSGLQLFVERVIPKGVELVVKVLPDLVVGLVKGIKNGIGSLFSKWFKWGGYKEEENIINLPKIGNLNANSTPFQDALLGWAKTGQNTSLSTIVPKYNTTTGTQVKISSGGQVTIESGMTSDDKMSAIAGIVNQNNGPLDSGVSFTKETIIGGYTFAELTSGKLSNNEIKEAVASFSAQHNLDEAQQKSIIDILSQSTIQTSDYTIETIRSLIKQNANADYVQKRNTITTIMKLVKQSDKYYDTNGLNEEQTEEVYALIAKILNDSKINTPDNKLYQIETQVTKYVSQIKKDHAFDTAVSEFGSSAARGILTGGIQNFRVGGLLKGTGKFAKHVPLPGFKTAGKVIEGSGKGMNKISGKIGNLGRGFANFGDNIILGMSDQVMDNIAKNPGKYLKGDDMVALAMNAGREAQIDATAKAAKHAAAHGFSEEATERIATKFGQNAAEKAVGETAQNLTASGLKESTEKISSRIASRTAQNAAEETVEGAAKGATKNSGLIAKFCNWVGKKIGELFGNSKVVGWIKNSKIGKKMAGKSVEEVMQAAAKKIGATIAKILPERIAKAGTSALAKITSVFGTGGTITIAFAIADFISGCTNAESIMGVTKDQEISWGQRLCAGLVKCVNGFVTLGFVPENILYDLFIDVLGPALGFDTSSLQEMRDEAQAQLDEYNLEHGTNLTMEEYNKKNSWWGKTKDKIGEVAGKAWDKTKEFGSKAWNKTKEVAGKAWNATKKGAKWLGNKAKDAGHYLTGNVFNDDKIREELGLDPDTKITLQDRISMGGATLINKLTFGTVDTEKTVKKINGAIEMVKNKASETWEGIKEGTKKKWDELKTGAVEGVKKANEKLGAMFGMEDDKGNPVSLTEGISNKWKKWKTDFKKGWEDTKKKASDTWKNIKEDTKEKWNDLKTGAVEGVKKANEKLGALFGMVDEEGNQLSLTEGVAHKWDAWKTSAAEGWKNIKDKASETWKKMKEGTKKSWDKLKEDASKGLTRIDEKLGALFGFEDANGKAQSLSAGVKEKFNAAKSKLKDGWNSVKEKASGFWDGVKNWFGNIGKTLEASSDAATAARNGKGKGKPRFGMSKMSQLDPNIANLSYNGHTIGEAGCGPVAAANVINNVRGGGLSVQAAADYATSLGYKPRNDGTDPRYMNSILSANGIPNQNISGRGSIRQNLVNGNPVVIMGQGHSDQSPYGKYNPHYITAMGYDSRGNIIVDDPYESDYTTYKESDIMNGIMKSTAVGKNGFGRGRFGFGRFGMGKLTDTQLSALTKKAFAITNKWEGSYDSVIPNDNGSWSVGIAGFHGTAKIKPLFEAMAAKLTGTARDQALKFAGWGSKILTSSEAAEVKAFLNANAAVSKEVQDKHLTEHIQGANFATAIKMYEAGELLDPRSIVLIGDIANTGPAHVDTWRKVHTKASSAATDLENTKNSLKTKSFWANPSAKCAKYKQGWLNRIENTYNVLKDWDGVTVDSSIGGTSTGGTGTGGLFQAITELGTGMVKSIYGEDVYEAIFGSQAQAAANGGTNAANGSVEKFVQAALGEEGYVEKASNSSLDNKSANPGSSNYTKYGKHFGNTGPSWPWCAQFVSWAADQAQLPTDAMIRSASCATIESDFKKKGRFHNKSGYTPKRGDVVLFTSSGSSHVGIVTGMKDGQVKTIEGNTSNKVAQRSYSPSNSKITGYGDLGLGTATGTTGLDGTDGTTNAFGKGFPRFTPRRNFGFGKDIIGTRTNNVQGAKVVNLRPSYGATNQTVVARGSVGGSATPTAGRSVSSNYVELLKIVIEALYKVAGNTEKISMIYDILAQKLNIDTSDSKSSNNLESKKTKVDNALKKLEAHSTFDGNTPEVSDADVEAILQMMTAIARE